MSGFHHIAYACRDAEETRHFYEDLMGFPLVHTELSPPSPEGGFLRHLFFDTGDGSCIAFFDLHGAGERPDFSTSLSEPNGVPVWVNHAAFRATQERQDEVKARMADADVKPLMELDHGWCHSVYFLDPNGIMVELCRDTPGLPTDTEDARRLLTASPSSGE
jgi:catechol 2,3-dioxygenase-like lactoylglutathione lyase family enzyme